MLKIWRKAFPASGGEWRRYGGNFGWLMLEKFVRLVMGFTVGVYVTRMLGPERFGLLNYAVSFAGIAGVLVGFGLEQVLIKLLVETPERRGALLGTAAAMKASGVVLMAAAVAIGLAFSHDDAATQGLVWIAAIGYCFVPLAVTEYWFSARVEAKFIAQAQIAAWLLVCAGRVAAVIGGCSLGVFAALESAYLGLLALFYAFFFYRNHRDFRWGVQMTLVRRLWRAAWPLWVGAMLYMVYMRFDQLLLKALSSDAELGYYNAALRLAELLFCVGAALSATFFPAIVRAKQGAAHAYRQTLVRFFCLIFYVNFVAAVGMFLVGPWVMPIYGEAYAAATGVFAVYIWRVLFFAMTYAALNWYLLEGLQHFQMGFYGVTVAASILLNCLLIGRWGATGAAVTAVITQFALIYLWPLLFRRTRNLSGILWEALDFRVLFKSVR